MATSTSSSKSAAKIQKTIARQKEKIAEGSFYEAHQQLRTIASRYTKSADYPAAIDVLSSGALALLNAGQGGSGADLGLQLLDVFEKRDAAAETDKEKRGDGWASDRGKLLAILRAFPPGEQTRKGLVQKCVAYSTKVEGEKWTMGDPELHHAVGVLYADEAEPYEAERHLALGTKDSAEVLAKMEYDWYTQDSAHTAALYAARAIFPYLLTSNLRAANKAYLIFTSRLSSLNSSLSVQEVSSTSSDMRVYPSLPLLNFLGLLLLAVRRGSSDLYKLLAKHYAVHVKEVGIWDDALAQIGELYFGIRIPRQGNPFLDMMGSMMGFGGGGGGSAKSKPKKVEAQAPPAEGLD